MADKNKVIKKIIVFSVIFFLIGGVAGYFIGENSSKGNFRRGNTNFPNSNFQINDSTKLEIEYFFNNTPDTGEINNYCQNNPRYCVEYCRNINPSNEICAELNNSFRGGFPTK
jgi:hypothetical protein